MDYQALEKIFGKEAARKIRTLAQDAQSLDWSARQMVTLCEGYPKDVSTEKFRLADELNSAGWACHCMTQFENAINYYIRALKLCPDFTMVWNNKGLAHFRLGNFDEAKEAYEKAIKINPLFIKPYSNMGILHIELKGDNKSAKEWLFKALTLDPNYQRARMYLEKIQDSEGSHDVLMLGTDPEFAAGLINAFQKKGLKARWFR